MCAVCESRGKSYRWMADVWEKRVTLAAKEATQKLGYEDVNAC